MLKIETKYLSKHDKIIKIYSEYTCMAVFNFYKENTLDAVINLQWNIFFYYKRNVTSISVF